MPNQPSSQMSAGLARIASKRDDDSVVDSHEYTLCMLGDWALSKTTGAAPTSSSTTNSDRLPSAVREISAEFDSPIVQVSCGSGWSCLLCEDGRAYSFGDNTYGQLGQGHNRSHVRSPSPLSAPYCLQPRRRIIKLSCGSAHGGFVLDSGELYMFGSGSYGRLGTGNEHNACVPTLARMKWSTVLAAVPSATAQRKQQTNVAVNEDDDEVRFADVSCGDRHTLALATRAQGGNMDSKMKSKTGIISFGDGMNGRLGLGDEKDRYEGALIATWLATSDVPGNGVIGTSGCMAPPTITAICAGVTHNLALSSTGGVFSWGNGVDGQLGHGVGASEWVPRQIAFFNNVSVVAISCGTSHSIALSRSGVVYSWGRGNEGQLGIDLELDASIDSDGRNVCVPHPVGVMKGSTQRVAVRTITAKQHTTIVRDDRDRLFVWGDNALEQLGIPLPVTTNADPPSKLFVPKPKLLAYMDIRAPKTFVVNSQVPLSRVASFRELVSSSKPEPIRLELVHIGAGDRFTMLVFRTKPGIGSVNGNNTSGDFRGLVSVPPGACAAATTNTNKWSFSLNDELPVSSIPSREPAYYTFMLNYKVYVRPTQSRVLNDDDGDREPQRRPVHRRRSTAVASQTTASADKQGSNVEMSSPAYVKGFDEWLSKRMGSPPKTSIASQSFSPAQRSASSPKKEDEARNAVTSCDDKNNQVTTRFPTKPQRPKSVYDHSPRVK